MELINNTLKHAAADEISITIQTEPGMVVCTYSDNGKGLPGQWNGKGLGMKGMEGRISAVGGTFETGNNEKGSFEAHFSVPFHTNEI